jgi:hypothetical protein
VTREPADNSARWSLDPAASVAGSNQEALGRLVVLVLVLLSLGLAAWWGWPFFHDDAFITLRYVDRALHGKGLTWTSVGPPVEGFTHPLWMLELLGLGAAGFDLEWAARVLGLGFFAAIAAFWYARRLWPLPLVALATSPPVALWAGGGLETVSFAFWCVVAAAFALRRGEALSRGAALAWGAALGACALTRPEGAGVALVALVFRGRRPADRSALLPVAATMAAMVAAYLAFRLGYYHEWLPNTAYAKIRAFSSAERLSRCLAQLTASWQYWVPVALAVLAGFVPGDRARARRSALAVTAVLASPILASWVLAGGDHMPALRPLVPVIALAAAGLASPAARGAATFAGVALWAGWNVFVLAGEASSVRRDAAASNGERAGRLLARHLPEGSVVAAATAGSTPYFAPQLEFVDTLGLNDRHIAARSAVPVRTRGQRLYPGHEKGDGAYVLALRPDVIVLGPSEGFPGVPPDSWYLTDLELAETPAFWDEYAPYVFLAPPAPPTPWRRMDPRSALAPLQVVFFLSETSPRVEGLRAAGARLLVLRPDAGGRSGR